MQTTTNAAFSLYVAAQLLWYRWFLFHCKYSEPQHSRSCWHCFRKLLLRHMEHNSGVTVEEWRWLSFYSNDSFEKRLKAARQQTAKANRRVRETLFQCPGNVNMLKLAYMVQLYRLSNKNAFIHLALLENKLCGCFDWQHKIMPFLGKSQFKINA